MCIGIERSTFTRFHLARFIDFLWRCRLIFSKLRVLMFAVWSYRSRWYLSANRQRRWRSFSNETDRDLRRRKFLMGSVILTMWRDSQKSIDDKFTISFCKFHLRKLRSRKAFYLFFTLPGFLIVGVRNFHRNICPPRQRKILHCETPKPDTSLR